MNNDGLTKLFQLEKEMRQADTLQALSFIIVNRLRSLIVFDQSVLFIHEKTDMSARVTMISDVPHVEKNAPFVCWLTQIAQHEVREKRHDQPHLIQQAMLPEAQKNDWLEWGHPQVLWLPLKKTEEYQVASLWISRREPFLDSEMALLKQLTEVAAHALWALNYTRSPTFSLFSNKKWLYAVAVCVFAISFVPVEQTVLAPAQVIAKNPMIVAAPMNGVVADVNVEPSTPVNSGDVLLRYEDTELNGRFLIAQEEVLLAQTELLSAQQAAFSDTRVKAQIAILESRFELRKAERDYVKKQVEKIDVTAPGNGVAIFNNRTDLIGLPVKTGQRLMQIADPHQTRLQIDLPVADGLSFSPGARVRLFLDKAPLNSVESELVYSSFDPYVTPSGVLSYRLIAHFKTEHLPRLGLHGTAKISGDSVSLFYYIFRRPLTAMRQMIGF